MPGGAENALQLESGAPAVAADVLAAGERLATALEDQGYAFAKVDTPIAYEDPPNRVLDVKFHVETGTLVKIGEIRLKRSEDGEGVRRPQAIARPYRRAIWSHQSRGRPQGPARPRCIFFRQCQVGQQT